MVDNIVRTFTTQNTAAQGANITNPVPSGPTPPLEELFKYSGPYSACTSRQFYWDQILNISVWAPTPQLDARKAHVLPRLQNYGSLPDLPDSQKVHINLVHHERPIVFLLTSGDTETIPQAMRAGSRFDRLGYSVVPVQGLGKSFDLSSNGVRQNARRGHLAWLLCFFPKLLELTKDLNDDDKFFVAEDSCLPIVSATPGRVASELRASGNCCLWMGYLSMESPPPMCTVRQEITVAAGHVVNF